MVFIPLNNSEKSYKMDKTLTIILISSMFLLGGFIGYTIKRCPECVQEFPVDARKVINNSEKIIEHKEKEIKKETYEEVKKIYHADVPELDSIWHDFARRYSKDSH